MSWHGAHDDPRRHLDDRRRGGGRDGADVRDGGRPASRLVEVTSVTHLGFGRRGPGGVPGWSLQFGLDLDLETSERKLNNRFIQKEGQIHHLLHTAYYLRLI